MSNRTGAGNRFINVSCSRSVKFDFASIGLLSSKQFIHAIHQKATLEETDKRDGKIISVSRATLSADGKSMSIAVTDKLRGTTSQ
jgi:hypothetical protein